MKKRILLTTLSLCSAAALLAQSQQFTRHHSGHRRNMPYTQGKHTAAKTTDNNASRCIAVVEYGSPAGTFIVQDSATYSYSGSRGSYPGGYPWKYDNGIEYSNSSGVYANDYKYTQTFDANNNVTVDLTQSWNAATSSWVNYDQELYTYDAMNNCLNYVDQNWDVPSGAWVSNFKAIYAYSGVEETTETDQSWNSATSSWVNVSLYTNTYDGAGNNTQTLVQNWNTVTSTWNNSEKYTYAYDGMNNNTSQLAQVWNNVTSSWVNSYKYTYSSFIARNCNQLEVEQNWDSASAAFVNSQETILTYNSSSQVTYNYSQSWDTAGSGSWYTSDYEYASRFYYELYTSGVASIPNTGGKALIYPVPAKDALSINITWDEAQAFTISLYDMSGRLFRQSQVPSTVEYKDNLPVNDLPAGNYILKMEGAKGNMVQTVTIAN